MRVTMKTFNDPRVLNIFSDASVTHIGQEHISCHGIYDPKNDYRSTTILRNSTNNRGELMGVIDGILYAITQRDKYTQINLWTDSSYSMKSICEWFPAWYLRKRDGVLYTNAGKVLENQDLINCAVNLILDNNLRINILHQRGHVLEKNNLKNAIMSFTITNRIVNSKEEMTIDQDAMQYASVCNQIVDEFTRNMFLKSDITQIPSYIWPISPYFRPGLDLKRLLILTRKAGDLETPF